MWRVRRYDPKLLSDSLAELGWKTIERIDYGPDGKDPRADAPSKAVIAGFWAVPGFEP